MKRFFTGLFLLGLFLLFAGFAVGSQYYAKPFNTLHGQDYGLALASVILVAMGAFTITSLLFGKKTRSES